MIGLGVYRLHQESGAGHCAVRENQHGHRNGVTQLAAGCTAVGSAVTGMGPNPAVEYNSHFLSPENQAFTDD